MKLPLLEKGKYPDYIQKELDCDGHILPNGSFSNCIKCGFSPASPGTEWYDEVTVPMCNQIAEELNKEENE